VYLVVSSLLAGFLNSDRLSDLQRRLDDWPSELESLFDRIFNNLEPFYYTHACQLIRIFEAYNDAVTNQIRLKQMLPPALLALFFADKEDSTTWIISAGTDTLSLEAIENNEYEMRRLNSRCRGLLIEATDGNSTEEDTAPPKVLYLSSRT
jgi:hypothetical protein